MAVRILKVGGMYNGMQSKLMFQSSIAVEPDTVIKHVIEAKQKENKETSYELVPGEMALEDICEQYKMANESSTIPGAEFRLKY